jgi:hypothetical protein
MKSPTLAAFAPGVEVAGKMVSATSFKKLMSSAEKLRDALAAGFLHPDKKASAPSRVPPSKRVTADIASLLFINYLFSVITNFVF